MRGLGNQLCRFARLRFVGIALENGACRDTVRCEDYRDILAHFSLRIVSADPELFGEGLDKVGLIVPGLHKIKTQPGISATAKSSSIEADTGARILRRQADYD